MAKKIDVNEIDERLIVSMVRKDQMKQEITPPPLVPLTASAQEPQSSLSPQAAISATMPVTEETQKPVLQPEQPKEENRRKRKPQDYEALFIRESNVTARLGKTVYVRKEFHDRILKIIQVIGKNEVSLFSYIDNIIAHHFDCYQDEIIHAYNSKNSNNLF